MYTKNAAAPRPPMGWNSWDCYGPAVTEETLLANAKVLAQKFLPYGWEYLVCDIQWSEPTAGTIHWEYNDFAPLTLDAYGRHLPAENRFPSSKDGQGFKPIADQVHAMGLKFGIHIMRGVPRLAVHKRLPVLGTSVTCADIAARFPVCDWNTDMYGVDASKPGAQAYYDSIFRLYAQWGVDYVKVDDIASSNIVMNGELYPYAAEIELIHNAIRDCGRPIALSLSPGPAPIQAAWHLRTFANLWRISGDFWDDWKALKAMFRRCELWQRQVSPGCWPDCDMLPFGHIAITTDGKGRQTLFTKEEQRTVMNLWCLFRSPLMMGGELRDNDAFTDALLQNKELLALNQYGQGAQQLFRDENKAAWRTLGQDGTPYIALFNLSDAPLTVEAPISVPEMEIPSADATELWSGETLRVTNTIAATLAPHDSAVYRIQAV